MNNVNHSKIDKSQVALRFAQAGQSYVEHAIVQKQIAQHLFALIGEYCPDLFKNQFSNQWLSLPLDRAKLPRILENARSKNKKSIPIVDKSKRNKQCFFFFCRLAFSFLIVR